MSKDKPEFMVELPKGCVPLPEHLDGIADAAFRMIEAGECPDDMLNTLKHGLKKSQPQKG